MSAYRLHGRAAEIQTSRLAGTTWCLLFEPSAQSDNTLNFPADVASFLHNPHMSPTNNMPVRWDVSQPWRPWTHRIQHPDITWYLDTTINPPLDRGTQTAWHNEIEDVQICIDAFYQYYPEYTGHRLSRSVIDLSSLGGLKAAQLAMLHRVCFICWWTAWMPTWRYPPDRTLPQSVISRMEKQLEDTPKVGVVIDLVRDWTTINLPLWLRCGIPVYYQWTTEVETNPRFSNISPSSTMHVNALANGYDQFFQDMDARFSPRPEMRSNLPADGHFVVDFEGWRRRSILKSVSKMYFAKRRLPFIVGDNRFAVFLRWCKQPRQPQSDSDLDSNDDVSSSCDEAADGSPDDLYRIRELFRWRCAPHSGKSYDVATGDLVDGIPQGSKTVVPRYQDPRRLPGPISGGVSRKQSRKKHRHVPYKSSATTSRARFQETSDRERFHQPKSRGDFAGPSYSQPSSSSHPPPLPHCQLHSQVPRSVESEYMCEYQQPLGRWDQAKTLLASMERDHGTPSSLTMQASQSTLRGSSWPSQSIPLNAAHPSRTFANNAPKSSSLAKTPALDCIPSLPKVRISYQEYKRRKTAQKNQDITALPIVGTAGEAVQEVSTSDPNTIPDVGNTLENPVLLSPSPSRPQMTLQSHLSGIPAGTMDGLAETSRSVERPNASAVIPRTSQNQDLPLKHDEVEFSKIEDFDMMDQSADPEDCVSLGSLSDEMDNGSFGPADSQVHDVDGFSGSAAASPGCCGTMGQLLTTIAYQSDLIMEPLSDSKGENTTSTSINALELGYEMQVDLSRPVAPLQSLMLWFRTHIDDPRETIFDTSGLSWNNIIDREEHYIIHFPSYDTIEGKINELRLRFAALDNPAWNLVDVLNYAIHRCVPFHVMKRVIDVPRFVKNPIRPTPTLCDQDGISSVVSQWRSGVQSLLASPHSRAFLFIGGIETRIAIHMGGVDFLRRCMENPISAPHIVSEAVGGHTYIRDSVTPDEINLLLGSVPPPFKETHNRRKGEPRTVHRSLWPGSHVLETKFSECFRGEWNLDCESLFQTIWKSIDSGNPRLRTSTQWRVYFKYGARTHKQVALAEPQLWLNAYEQLNAVNPQQWHQTLLADIRLR